MSDPVKIDIEKLVQINDKRKIILIDFDGTIMDNKAGWKDGVLYGNVVPGFFEWADQIDTTKYRLVVYSSRSSDPQMLAAMENWVRNQYDDWIHARMARLVPRGYATRVVVINFEFSAEKMPAYITIDDRAIQFRGDWSASNLTPSAIDNFKTWNGR